MVYTWKLDPGSAAHPRDFDPRHTDGVGRSAGEAQLGALQAELGELQELCYAAQRHAVLIVLQGMDTSGKDGTIRRCWTASTRRVPRHLLQGAHRAGAAHDFLWRVHSAGPRQGMIGIFNRSHYEDVLIVRVHELVPEDVWRRRYEHINAFERCSPTNGTIVLKFFLHISKEEQAERLLARETDVDKRWKLNAARLPGAASGGRSTWPPTQDALRHCATPHAPWYVVPSDRKWFRNLAVAPGAGGCAAPLPGGVAASAAGRGAGELQELLELRAQGKGQLCPRRPGRRG